MRFQCELRIEPVVQQVGLAQSCSTGQSLFQSTSTPGVPSDEQEGSLRDKDCKERDENWSSDENKRCTVHVNGEGCSRVIPTNGRSSLHPSLLGEGGSAFHL